MRKVAVILAITCVSTRGPLADSVPRPKLAVVIVVDQMRADYVERFRGGWRSGLERLVTRGAWFRQAAYPYSDTVTCPGHATVATGQLGRHDRTDFLAVSFSTPDSIGHAFGPRSQEIRDTYAHLDRTIGLLLDTLDELVGRDQYVVALTADHGVARHSRAGEGRTACWPARRRHAC